MAVTLFKSFPSDVPPQTLVNAAPPVDMVAAFKDSMHPIDYAQVLLAKLFHYDETLASKIALEPLHRSAAAGERAFLSNAIYQIGFDFQMLADSQLTWNLRPVASRIPTDALTLGKFYDAALQEIQSNYFKNIWQDAKQRFYPMPQTSSLKNLVKHLGFAAPLIFFSPAVLFWCIGIGQVQGLPNKAKPSGKAADIIEQQKALDEMQTEAISRLGVMWESAALSLGNPKIALVDPHYGIRDINAAAQPPADQARHSLVLKQMQAALFTPRTIADTAVARPAEVWRFVADAVQRPLPLRGFTINLKYPRFPIAIDLIATPKIS